MILSCLRIKYFLVIVDVGLIFTCMFFCFYFFLIEQYFAVTFENAQQFKQQMNHVSPTRFNYVMSCTYDYYSVIIAINLGNGNYQLSYTIDRETFGGNEQIRSCFVLQITTFAYLSTEFRSIMSECCLLFHFVMK